MLALFYGAAFVFIFLCRQSKALNKTVCPRFLCFDICSM